MCLFQLLDDSPVNVRVCQSPSVPGRASRSSATDGDGEEVEVEPGELLLAHSSLQKKQSGHLQCGSYFTRTCFPVYKSEDHCFRCIHDCLRNCCKSKRCSYCIPDHSGFHTCKNTVGQAKGRSHLSVSHRCGLKSVVQVGDTCGVSAQPCSPHRSIRYKGNVNTPKSCCSEKSLINDEIQSLVRRKSASGNDSCIRLKIKNNKKEHEINFPPIKLPTVKTYDVAQSSSARGLPSGTLDHKIAAKLYVSPLTALVLPTNKILQAQHYLPSDDKLLALPLLRLPHQVQQPRHFQHKGTHGWCGARNRCQKNESMDTLIKEIEHIERKVRKQDDNWSYFQEQQTISVAGGSKHRDINSNILPDKGRLPAASKKSMKIDSLSEVCGVY